jgi:uncharacterized protein YndB with AHSA1/START domain
MAMDAYGKMLDPHTLQFVRILPGPIERIWAYLWDSEKRGQWFATGAMPAKAGETFEFTWKHSTLSPNQAPPPEKYREMDKTGHRATSTLLACEPPHLLAFTFGGESEVEFRLASDGDTVRFTLTHRKIPDRAVALQVSGGWHSHLAILQYKAEGKVPPAFWDVWRENEGTYESRIP